jgi:hypothetical protein
MTDFRNPGDVERALQLVGELLEADGHHYHIVVIGGAALNLLGLRIRSTTDVDILAQATTARGGAIRLRPPDQPLPEPLMVAARTVAADLRLDPNWLNAGPAGQWITGLPPGLETRLVWRSHAGLTVGLVARQDLVFFKLYAAADDPSPNSVHFRDLVSLAPADDELAAAAAWIAVQDPTPEFNEVVAKVIRHVRDQSRHDR